MLLWLPEKLPVPTSLPGAWCDVFGGEQGHLLSVVPFWLWVRLETIVLGRLGLPTHLQSAHLLLWMTERIGEGSNGLALCLVGCFPGCSQTGHPPASASQELGLQVCATTSSREPLCVGWRVLRQNWLLMNQGLSWTRAGQSRSQT